MPASCPNVVRTTKMLRDCINSLVDMCFRLLRPKSCHTFTCNEIVSTIFMFKKRFLKSLWTEWEALRRFSVFFQNLPEKKFQFIRRFYDLRFVCDFLLNLTIFQTFFTFFTFFLIFLIFYLSLGLTSPCERTTSDNENLLSFPRQVAVEVIWNLCHANGKMLLFRPHRGKKYLKSVLLLTW